MISSDRKNCLIVFLLAVMVSILLTVLFCGWTESNRQSEQAFIDEVSENVVTQFPSYASVVDDFDGQYYVQVVKEYPKGKVVIVSKDGYSKNVAFFLSKDMQYKVIPVPMHNSPTIDGK